MNIGHPMLARAGPPARLAAAGGALQPPHLVGVSVHLGEHSAELRQLADLRPPPHLPVAPRQLAI
eukprot:CAMPEP_0113829840 /NCGR_PEP_ID=MMETSP0328-20130328/6013_1 /TAXON_ID=39455 /ORGANISM="Alexandrium minutum" /LENGTH=64 /DNA_ID=CAMNT_0000797919 /DNA_START=149 /DNA_END=340 /DNA_ORIENTATION=+ /assembly_acc=CAM_ASM_000350